MMEEIMDLETAQRTVKNRFIGPDEGPFQEAVKILHFNGESFPLEGATLDRDNGIVISDKNLFAVRTVHGLIFVRENTAPLTR